MADPEGEGDNEGHPLDEGVSGEVLESEGVSEEHAAHAQTTHKEKKHQEEGHKEHEGLQPAEEEELEESPEGEKHSKGGDEETLTHPKPVPVIAEENEEAAAKGEKQHLTANAFDAGESPRVHVGEQLSREGSADREQDDYHFRESPPQARSPNEEDESDGEDYEAISEREAAIRESLVQKYHDALADRQQLQEYNYQLQHKIAEHNRKKRLDERIENDRVITDQEQRYLKYMASLDELKRNVAAEKQDYKDHIEATRRASDRKIKYAEEAQKAAYEFQKSIALGAVNSRSGKPLPPREIEQLFIREKQKDEEVVVVRLENIKLKHKLRKKEAILKAKEELAEGLHMIDFEQLKIENQTYNEKIEERNEELLKLRKKITSTVQVMTHLKEKLQHLTGEVGKLRGHLDDIDEVVSKRRDLLTRTKQARDALRIDNQKLRANSGLLGHNDLLKDYEERHNEAEDLSEKLEHLKRYHAEITLNLAGYRKKIDQAKAARI